MGCATTALLVRRSVRRVSHPFNQSASCSTRDKTHVYSQLSLRDPLVLINLQLHLSHVRTYCHRIHRSRCCCWNHPRGTAKQNIVDRQNFTISISMPSQDFWDSVNDAVKPKDPCSDDCDAEIVESLSRLHAIVNTLRRHLNTHSAVNRLPSELLSEIFSYSAELSEEDGVYPYRRSGLVLIRSLQRITQVCSTWRKTALGNPLLWAHVPIGDWECGSAFLERSKELPVTLWGSIHNKDEVRACYPLSGFEEYLQRVSALFIMFSGSSRSIILPSQPALQLQTMAISSEDALMPLQPPLQLNTPMLKSLTLNSVTPSWAWVGTLLSLTSLTIHQSFLTNVSDILNALRNLQNLSFLRFKGKGYDGDDEHRVGLVEPVELPQLKHVTLTDTALRISRLLVRLSLPSDALLHLVSRTYAATDLLYLADAIAQNHRMRVANGGARKDSYRGFGLHFSSHRVTFFAAQDGQHIYDNPPHHDRSDLYPVVTRSHQRSVTMMVSLTGSSYLQLVNSLIGRDVLSPLTLVIMGLPKMQEQKMLLRWMSQRSLIRILCVSTFAWFARPFASHDATAGLGDPGEGGLLRLPFLEDLQVCNHVMNPVTIELLVGAGIKRCQGQGIPTLSAPITLHIHDCEIEAQEAEKLRTAFQGNFEWDGRTVIGQQSVSQSC